MSNLHNERFRALTYINVLLVAVLALCKFLRLNHSENVGHLDALQLIEAIRPELFAGISLFLIVYCLYFFTKKPFKYILAFYLIWLCFLVIEVSSTVYFLTTGDHVLDIETILHVVGNLGELTPVFLSIVNLWTLLIIIFVLVNIAFYTLYTFKRSRHLTHVVQKNDKKRVIFVFISGLSLFLSACPSSQTKNIASNQTATYQILSSVYDNEGAVEQSIKTNQNYVPEFPQGRLSLALPQGSRLNVTLIVLESTRASSTSLYNAAVSTTPFLESLSAQSILFEHAYAMMPHTSKSLVSILCGVEPGIFMAIREATQEDGIPARCLPHLLKEIGYKTVFFQTATQRFENRATLASNMGFDEFYASEHLDHERFEAINYFGLEDDAVLPVSHDWLNNASEETPLLSVYLTLTPHHDYKTPGHFKTHALHHEKSYNSYLNAIRYVDQFTDKVIQQHKAAGRYDNTVFVIVGDHGEGFGEHGHYFHDTVIFNEGLHVPMMIHSPSMPELFDKRVDTLFSTVDIVPSVLDILGHQIEENVYSGNRFAAHNQERVIFSHCWRIRACMAVYQNDFKLIHFFGRQEDRLYMFRTDPNETLNVIQEHQEVAAELLEKGKSWRNEVINSYKEYYRGEYSK